MPKSDIEISCGGKQLNESDGFFQLSPFPRDRSASQTRPFTSISQDVGGPGYRCSTAFRFHQSMLRLRCGEHETECLKQTWVVNPPVLPTIVVHQQIHPAAVWNLVESFTGLGLADLDLGQTVHRFLTHGIFSRNRYRNRMQGKETLLKLRMPLKWEALLRNENEEWEPGGLQSELPAQKKWQLRKKRMHLEKENDGTSKNYGITNVPATAPGSGKTVKFLNGI